MADARRINQILVRSTYLYAGRATLEERATGEHQRFSASLQSDASGEVIEPARPRVGAELEVQGNNRAQ